MKRVVYKYPFGNEQTIKVPAGRVVLVAAQFPEDVQPTVWVDHKVEERASMVLTVVGTGHIVPQWAHVGSAVCFKGSLVWHVYDVGLAS